ncbi:MAG: hypothetical protein NVS9B4_11170 [Candidatus Acidiferrum sp.]
MTGLLLGILAWSPRARAEHTRRWQQSTYEEFLKGTAHGVAVRSDGRLELAPKFTLVADADASYLWSLRVDGKGTLYAAAGSPAKVLRIDAAGKPATVFESTDLAAQAIAFDGKGTLYVGTSPDGKVYKVTSTGEKSVFFDPKTKYIWDLAFSADGTLYVATGDKGQIFAVDRDGRGELFYASDEAHIRVLGFDVQGNVIAGTEPSGRVLRITRKNAKSSRDNQKNAGVAGVSGPSGVAEGFVLYETSKREVTSLAVAADGTIYVSAIGEKQRGANQAPTAVFTSALGVTSISPGGATPATPQSPQPFSAFPQALSSSVYRIAPSGAPEELWNSREDVVYALGLAGDGRLLAGTGNNGALLAIDGRGIFAQLAKAASAQITAIVRGTSGKVFLCTANPGKVFSLGPEYEPEGVYESRSFDTQMFSQWGRLEWWSPAPRGMPAKTAVSRVAGKEQASPSSKEARLEFFVRSGNTEDPGKEWSAWFGPYTQPGAAGVPASRFAQWKAVIHDGRPGDGIDWVSLAYLPENVAPVIDAIAVQDPGVHLQSTVMISAGQPTPVALKMPPAPATSGVIITQSAPPPKFEAAPQGTQQKGYASVLWSAHDDNEDDLRYTVYYRGENEREWKLLKDKLDQKFYSWDTTGLPDGAYYAKILASDAPSNPAGVALSAERESERFLVDNTPPVIEGLEAGVTGSTSSRSLRVQFTARDAVSGIDKAQYSVDGGDWMLVAPAGKISDAREERYDFRTGSLGPGEHTVAVRAYDQFENAGSAKTTVEIQR